MSASRPRTLPFGRSQGRSRLVANDSNLQQYTEPLVGSGDADLET